MRGLGSFFLRSGIPLLLIPPVLLVLQLLVLGSRLPGAERLWVGAEEQDGAVAFSVISIEPERSSIQGEAQSRRTGVEEEEEEEDGGMREGAPGYEDENEMHERQLCEFLSTWQNRGCHGDHRVHCLEWSDGPELVFVYVKEPRANISKPEAGPRAVEVQLWAADKPSFTTELDRFIMYITRPQLNCSRVLSPGQTQAALLPAASAHWLLCAEDWLLPAADGPCVAYSFSMGRGDADFLRTVSQLGCEVHSFDPSKSNASGSHLGNSLASNHGNGGGVIQHKMWLEWRAPKRRRHKTRGNLGSVSQTLADIMAALGHHTVNFLYADLLSAEWRVFQNWIEEGTLQNIHHLVATVHLQWAGFEVGGTDEEVLRFWFSVLRELQASGLKLVHSSAGEGHSVLKQTVANAYSSYTLSWVNTRH